MYAQGVTICNLAYVSDRHIRFQITLTDGRMFTSDRGFTADSIPGREKICGYYLKKKMH